MTGTPAGSANRRAGRRRALRGAAVVRLAGDAPKEAIAYDLGEDGLSLVCARPISPGTVGEVSLDVPLAGETFTLTVGVRVVYSSYLGARGFQGGSRVHVRGRSGGPCGARVRLWVVDAPPRRMRCRK